MGLKSSTSSKNKETCPCWKALIWPPVLQKPYYGLTTISTLFTFFLPLDFKIFVSCSIFGIFSSLQLYCLCCCVNDFECANSSYYEIVQQKSSNSRINNMAKQPVLIFDFEKNPFDGDPGQTHQFIPFFLG